MRSSSEPAFKSMAATAQHHTRYLILKESHMYGPCEEDVLRDWLSTGRVVEGDLVRAEGKPLWDSVGHLLGFTKEAIFSPPRSWWTNSRLARRIRPHLETLANWTTQASRKPGRIALAALALATLGGFLLDESPLQISPWTFAALTAGIALFLKHRNAAGFGTCVAAMTIPLAIFLFDQFGGDDDIEPSDITSAIAGMPSTKAPSAPLQKRARVRSQIPALDLPQPTYADDQ